MIQKIKLALLTSLFGFGLVFTPLAADTVAAYDVESSRIEACKGIGISGANCSSGGSERRVTNFLGTIVNILSLIVGVAAVIMVIISGLKYITSNGDSNNIASAKNTLIYAIIGIVIVVLAQLIVQVVINKAAA